MLVTLPIQQLNRVLHRWGCSDAYKKITHFSYVRGSAGEAATKTLPHTPVQTAIEPNPASAKPLRREQVQRAIVMIADDLGLSAEDIPNVRKTMKNFVDGQMQLSDLVSVMTSSGGMGVMAQLTNDKRQLYAAIDRIRWLPGRTPLTWYDPVHVIDAASEFENASNRRVNAVRRPSLGAGTTGALASAIQGLREVPGRKAIALFSDGFPQSAGALTALANRASVVIYTFDPRGLASFFLTAVDLCKCGTARSGVASVRAAEATRQAVYHDSQRSLDELSRGTGGIFFHDNNDLVQGLVNALEDMSSYYLIGYQPHREDFENVRGNPRFHKIQVRIMRAGLLVRSRNGFAGTPDAPAGSANTRAEEMRHALFSPFQANGFPVHLSAYYSASARKDPKTGRRPALLRAMLAIDAHGLGFKDTEDGKKQLDLDIVAAAYGANNEVIASSDKTFSAAMTGDEMSRTIASGLVYNLDIEIPKPGPYQFRVAVRDANSERVGSAASFVEIPDFNRPGIVLSSVLLYDSDAKRNEELTREGIMGPGSPVTRVFGSSAVLGYDCAVFGATPDRQTGKPRIDVQVRLFRGPERIFSGQPIPLPIPAGTSSDDIHAAGEIRLPATLPPGDYIAELTVYDRVENRKLQQAAQWVDFTLVK
ncbi:MAG TPA: VWA domain-containing protein [Bryobacteraceae bacterium]|nr:VWA domain-containing protein [Bryobacteraceae bacterium]